MGTEISRNDEGQLVSTAYLNFSDDGGDNFKVTAFCVDNNGSLEKTDDKKMDTDRTGLMTVWRIRFVNVYAMERDGVDDVQQIPPGQGAPNEDCIGAGPNGSVDTQPGGDDEVDGNVINTGENGICETSASGDDTQIIQVGQGEPNQTCITDGPNNTLDLGAEAVQGDDVRDAANDRIHTGPNGICETNASSLYPSSNGSISDVISSLRSAYADTSKPNHLPYIDFVVADKDLNLPHEASTDTSVRAWRQYLLDHVHGGNPPHEDYHYDVVGVDTISGSDVANSIIDPHSAIAVSEHPFPVIGGNTTTNNNSMVHETGHSILRETNNIHADHTGGADDLRSCVFEQSSNGGAHNLEICERHTRDIRNNVTRTWDDHDVGNANPQEATRDSD